jgi:hypothetical protein
VRIICCQMRLGYVSQVAVKYSGSVTFFVIKCLGRYVCEV